jgi:hypothetical protein
MKRRLCAALAALPLTACTASSAVGSGGTIPDPPDSGPIPNPPGTVTANLDLAGHGGPDGILFSTGMVGSFVPSGTDVDIYLDPAGNFVAGKFGYQIILDVGPVPGLGALTGDPTTGFVASASAVVGDGYVVHLGSGDVRMYVSADIVSATSNGVIGKIVQWARFAN